MSYTPDQLDQLTPLDIAAITEQMHLITQQRNQEKH